MTTITPSTLERHTGRAPEAAAGEPAATGLRLAFVAPRHRDEPDWPWVTRIGSMRSCGFRRIFIDNDYAPWPKLTPLFQQWQYWRAMRAVRDVPLTFLFSFDLAIGMTGGLSRLMRTPRRVFVGFSQDLHWTPRRMRKMGRALRRCEAATVFTQAERRLYAERYGLDQQRVHVIPIHTDESDGYRAYGDQSPRERPYVLALGSKTRKFMPVARACCKLGIDLVVITRPNHPNDDLDEIAALGAEVITDADRVKALTYLKHARLAAAAFEDPDLPGGFATVVHAMFMRTPFVLTQSLGMDEHVLDGETGYVTPHDDEHALRDAIGRVWEDDALRMRFEDAALQRARDRHSLEAAAEMFYRLALKLLRE
jgi:glycosyltransferase involved in cell wall biosynthesis